MAEDRQSFLKKLLATFRVEAGEHLEAIRSGLLSLERVAEGERARILEQIFREAHSLKGAARAVSLADVERVCHSLESLFAAWKSNRAASSPALFDRLHETLDLVTVLVSLEQSSSGASPRLRSLLQILDAAAKARPVQPEEKAGAALPAEVVQPVALPADVPAPASLSAGTIRVQVAKLESIMRGSQELLGPRLAAAQRVADLRETRAELDAWRKMRQALRFSTHEPRQNAHEESEQELVFLKSLDARLARLEKAAQADHRALSGIVDCILQDVKETHMVPFSTLVEGLRKLVRDLARDREKQVELIVHGSELAADRRILEEIKAPLQHLLRNAVDHGIETPAVRQRKGKPAQGSITLAASLKANRIEIVIGDDGAGIDLSGVREAASRMGLAAADELERRRDEDVLPLLFQSGLSTSPRITEVSGRGLGMAIVSERVDRLGGRIDVRTRLDAGTTIALDLPLDLATFRGVLVQAGGRQFMIPAASVERVLRVSHVEIRTVENRETVSLAGRTLSLICLADVLELPRQAREERGYAQVVVVGTSAERIAFSVDRIVAEQEVLVRGLGPQLARVRNVAGACVLGSGEVVPVLNVPDLLASAIRAPASGAVAAGPRITESARHSILVVEDSITSRTLIKGILEASGYDVAVAVDGIDGYTQLKTRPFDLIVSDVEMPRMDGFELTAKVRADKTLAHIPVVLVTALESREYRERGIDAGASAYIVKNSFDQSDLLELIRRLI